jgi:hypothetical protein
MVPYASLQLSMLSPDQLKGLQSAAAFRWGDPWKDVDYLCNNLGIIASKDLLVTVDGGYQINLSNVYPPALPAPFKLGEAGPTVGIGRTAVHGLWVDEPGGLALETPYLAEVLCVVVPKRHPRRLYALAQFHEVRIDCSSLSRTCDLRSKLMQR